MQPGIMVPHKIWLDLCCVLTGSGRDFEFGWISCALMSSGSVRDFPQTFNAVNSGSLKLFGVPSNFQRCQFGFPQTFWGSLKLSTLSIWVPSNFFRFPQTFNAVNSGSLKLFYVPSNFQHFQFDFPQTLKRHGRIRTRVSAVLATTRCRCAMTPIQRRGSL